jgi:RNA polymerase sigma factor (sigma-70 family)
MSANCGDRIAGGRKLIGGRPSEWLGAMRQGTERRRLGARRRPTRAEIEPAALALLRRHGTAIMAAARRFAATPEDAEDAYQRGVEILLTKAPTTAEEELVPWLRTVVKHEAWALRRQRQRAAPVADDGCVPESPSEAAATHDQAEQLDRLRVGAEALRQLKPQEIRALVLRAEGYSYKQIQELTGWTYTKVNRCLTEGRKAFLARVAGIEGGSECDRLAPRLSRLADGEATADDLAALRPHIRTCLSCRAALREYRSAPRTAAALVPVAAFTATGRPPLLDAPAQLFEGISGLVQKAQSAAEMASAQKVAAVAASTAVLGGGAAVTVQEVDRQPDAAKPVARAGAGRPAPAPPPSPLPPQAAPAQSPPAPPQLSPAERRAQEAKRKTPPAQQEFEPAWAAGEPETDTVSAAAATDTGTGTAPPQPGGGAEEFAP